MNIESLLNPMKYADEQILRYYSKLTKKWEDKGHSRYSLAHAFNLSNFLSFPSFLISSRSTYNSLAVNLITGIHYPIFSLDIAMNIYEQLFRKEITDKPVAENPANYLYKKVLNSTRLPLFLTGVGLMGKSAYEIVDYFKTGKGGSLNSSISDLSLGYSFFGLSSSIYIKDSNPKLLDKAPFWKTAYDWTKEKVKSLVPSPQPVPQPSPAFSMENYLQTD